MRNSARRRSRHSLERRSRQLVLEQLERRVVLSIGMIDFGPSDNIALDQPRVAVELAEDPPDGIVGNWRSLGPGYFNTFLLDTGANSVMCMASATGELDGFVTEGQFEELGVAGGHLMDISAEYRLDYAGTSGIRNTIDPARILSDAERDFSQMGPWGIVGMPGMAGKVTSLDMTVWSGGGTGLELYMTTEFGSTLPASNGHRYALQVDNRVAFRPEASIIDGEPPVWADIPFLTATPVLNGLEQSGNFLFDTGGQMSVLSEHMARDIGLDSNGDGLLNSDDANFVTYQTVGGVGGEVSVPVFALDEVRITVTQVDSGDEVDMVWTDLQWLVLEIDTGPGQQPLDGVFGADLLTSGWFYAFFYPGMPDGYIDQLYFDFRDWEVYNGTPEPHTGTIYFDLNELADEVIPYGPGIRLRESDRFTEVIEGVKSDTYSIGLTSVPTAPVQITVTADDQVRVSIDGGATYHASVVLTLTDKAAKTITVAGIADDLPEGVHSGLITHSVASADSDYDNMPLQNVSVKVNDYVEAVRITSDAAGMNEIESISIAEGGAEVSYWVSLREPIQTVTYVGVDYPPEQVYARNPNPPLGFDMYWEFYPADWNVPQQALISAYDDDVAEGAHSVVIEHLAMEDFVVLGQKFVTVHIADNDAGNVLITQTGGSTDVAEGGATDTYQIALGNTPTGPVQITVTADAQTRLSLDGVTFTPTLVLTFNNTTPRTITVRAVDDTIDESTHVGVVSHAITGTVVDARYPTNLPIADVRASIVDNDAAGLRFTGDAAGQTPIESLSLVEGEVVTYWLALNSQPTHDVTIFLTSGTGQVLAVDDAHPALDHLTFTPLDWNVPQAIRVTGIADGVSEGAQADVITHSALSSDPQYQGSVPLPVSVADPPAAVVGRHIFYNNSKWDAHGTLRDGDPEANAFDDAAIAVDKVALRSGKATFANYTSFNRGINGIMIDIANLSDASGLSAADFQFRVGNSNDPTTWSSLPVDPSEITIAVRPGAGTAGSDRVTILFPDGAVKKTWLQVTVKATAATGLAAPDVHYWGNAVAESGNSSRNTIVDVYDALGVRANRTSVFDPTSIDDAYDYNRDKQVNVVDELLVRANLTGLFNYLRLIELADGQGEGEGEQGGGQSADSPVVVINEDSSDRAPLALLVPRTFLSHHSLVTAADPRAQRSSGPIFVSPALTTFGAPLQRTAQRQLVDPDSAVDAALLPGLFSPLPVSHSASVYSAGSGLLADQSGATERQDPGRVTFSSAAPYAPAEIQAPAVPRAFDFRGRVPDAAMEQDDEESEASDPLGAALCDLLAEWDQP